MITDEAKRQSGGLSLEFWETLERDGENANLEPLIDRWDASAENVGRVVCNDERDHLGFAGTIHRTRYSPRGVRRVLRAS